MAKAVARGGCHLLIGAMLALGASCVAAMEEPWFTDEAEAAGLVFRHYNGMSGAFYSAEIMGPGVALFDYDNDGDLDVYLVQGAMLGPKKTWADARFPPPSDYSLTDRLFRNDLAVAPDGSRRLRFTDVSAEAGLVALDYGMGVATGDYDNDGWTDLYVTGFRSNRLLRNNGDGTFTDRTDEAGVQDERWTVSAGFLDFDRDGWLDLYAGNYVDLDLVRHEPCVSRNSAKDYCTPLAYQSEPDSLWRNRGDGSFEDVSARSGLTQSYGAALGVVAADFNGDGRTDIYVANDAMPNQLWLNQGDGRFVDDAFLSGVAVNLEGAPEAGMGVDAADFDGDGDEDLFLTHLQGETNTLYVNNGKGWFEDRTLATGLAAPSRPFTAFGTAWFDYDNDGRLDLFTANGDITLIRALMEIEDPFPLHQTNQLYRNLGDSRFEETTAGAGPVFSLSEVSRGAAFGDIDNDGDIDIVVANNNGPVRLLLNRAGSRRHWLGLTLEARGGRGVAGTRVALLREGAPPLWRRARVDGSYGSAGDPRVLIGLGGRSGPQVVEVHWLDGTVERWRGLAPDAYHPIRQGAGVKRSERSP